MTTIAAEPTEQLENGYLTATASGDNLLLDYARGEAAAFAATIGSAGGRTDRDSSFNLQLCDLGVPSPFGNVALIEQPIDSRSTAELVATMRSYFGERPGGPYLVFSPWPLDLSGHGYALVGHPPLMLRPAGGTAPVADGLRIKEVGDAETLADFERTLIEAYPVPEMQPVERESMFGPKILDTPWRLFVGYDGDRPVSTAGAFVTPTLTIVELVSTREECRGKGYGSAVTAAATLVEPTNPAMLIASDPGRNSYARLGYIPLLRYSLWLGMR